MRIERCLYGQSCGIFVYPVCELWHTGRIKSAYFHIFYCEYPCVSKWGLLPSVRNIHRRCSVRKRSVRNFPKFTGKHLCQGLFSIKLQALAHNFINKETLAQVFSCEVCEISKSTFFREHLKQTVSEVCIAIVHNSQAKCL